MYCKADFKSIAKCKKWLCAAVFSLFLKNMRRAAWPVLQSRCKALSAPPQSTPKNTKTGRKSVGFLILTQAPKCTRSHRFPPQKHPKNGFVLRFAGKNSFLQVRSAHVLILSALSHLSLRDSKLTWYRKGAVARSRSVAPGAETAQVLWDVFGLRAPEDAAL